MAPTARNAYQSVFAPGLCQGQVVVAVSYTHLTLPTIYSV